ncbi:MAG: hypothetical protein KJ638_02405 [Chloroflexi bacterium]|nr:hypothetical protein [Chloroflexota bacterium]
MTEIRCPMCGKPNPDQLEVCQFCAARLKPLSLSARADEAASPLQARSAHESDEGLPDWLNSMREEEDDPAETAGDPSPEEESEALGWLARLRDESDPQRGIPPRTKSVTPFEGELSSPEDDDWLQRIRDLHQENQQDDQDISEPEPEKEKPSGWASKFILDTDEIDADENGVSDWFSGKDEEVSPELAAPAVDSGLPDWLRAEAAESVPAVASGEGDLPDWLSGEDEEVSPELAAPAVGGGLPDWLRAEAAESVPAAASGEGDLPDWFSGEDEEIAPELAASAVDSGLPDWLRAEAAESVPAVAFDEDDLPGWLSGEDEEISPEPAASAVEGGLPDWLRAEAVESVPAVASGEGDLPDWFSGEDEGIAPEPAAPSVEGGLPDWLSDLRGEPPPFGEPEAEPVGPSLYAETPDWVSDLGGGDEPASASPDEADDLPDWFADLGEEESTLFGEPEAAPHTPAEEEEIPGWIVSGLAAPVAPFVIDDEFDDDLLDVDKLPDWLAGKLGEQDTEDDTEASDLAPAELPGWLEAMRPVETSTPGTVLDDDGLVESVGPLAGLRNVLPAEPGIDRMKNPPTYSVKLHVAESQQAHAALFEELLANEGQALPVPPPSRLSSQRIMRWLIALILCVVVGFVVVGGSQNVPLPDQADVPAETFAASKLVNALPDASPVLVAFDYEPGMSGEMNAAAAALVDHLMLRGARLTLVSTSPTGPAMAEYFLRNIEAEREYVSGIQYINLGYIPGGAAGLRGFAEMPRLITTLSFDNMNPWGTPPLQGVDAISDFALVVVITDDSDTARTWIEQVQPKLGNTPFVAILSAQAAPMIRPYYGTQVQGMVTGLIGGAAYEQSMGQDSYNLARVYWDAFSVGLLVAVAAILIGGAVNIISVLLAHKKGTKGEAV